MNKNLRKAWEEFRHMISELDERDTPIIIFQRIRDWYQKNKKKLSPYLIEEYGLEKLVNIDIKAYPIEHSECTPESIRGLLHLELSSEDSLAMLLRDQFWELVVLTVAVECQICKNLGMSALFDESAKKVVLECTQCGWTQTSDGYPYEPLVRLQLAQNDDLKIAELI